jgi:glycogen phosphorylase
MYEPAAARVDVMTRDKGARARDLAAWKQRVAKGWGGVKVHAVDSESALADLGSMKKVEAVVGLGILDEDDVEVQLIHGPVGANEELVPVHAVTMELVGLDDSSEPSARRYAGSFGCDQAGRYGFAVRVVPSHPDLTTFAELGCVVWA